VGVAEGRVGDGNRLLFAQAGGEPFRAELLQELAGSWLRLPVFPSLTCGSFSMGSRWAGRSHEAC
jgi:hypothetical protein